MKNKKYLYLLLLIVPIIVFFVGNAYSLPGSEPIASVEITSDDYPGAGEWKIDKSAKWIGYGKARVTFDINSMILSNGRKRDIIFVVDKSGSMEGEKIDRVKSDAASLAKVLLNFGNNRVSLISFSSTAYKTLDFTNTYEEFIQKLEGLSPDGETNYNDALKEVDKLLENYDYEEGSEVLVLFLTDGYPNVETPSEVGTYGILKEKYPYLTINGVQYEMGNEVINQIKVITDDQWIADIESLHNTLFEASFSSFYEEFIVTDFIDNDYFYVDSNNDIKVSIGEATIEGDSNNQKVVWNLGEDTYLIGGNAQMTIDLKLKDQYKENSGLYPTNKGETIKSKMHDESEKTVNSSLTPILKNQYQVIYEPNGPSECTFDAISNENHFVGTNVNIRQETLLCDGYVFQGWDIETNDALDITTINDEIFIMPEHDVHIRGTWTIQGMIKTMDGTIHEKMTLYKVMENASIDGTYAFEYNGEHNDSIDGNGDKAIYFWNKDTDLNSTINEKNNVYFAGHCWKMFRTTDTGGVKLLYSGEYDEELKCTDDRGKHDGYKGKTYVQLKRTDTNYYYYGTDYTYNPTTKEFSLAGTISPLNWSLSTSSNIIGKYTCRGLTPEGTCSTLYYVYEANNENSAYVLIINGNANTLVYGTQAFNDNTSLARVGYMYNVDYNILTRREALTDYGFVSYQSMDSGPNYSFYYGDSFIKDGNQYYLQNYSKIDWSNNNSQLEGKYTCLSKNDNLIDYNGTSIPLGTKCGSLYYVISSTGVSNRIVYSQVINNSPFEDNKIVISKSIIDNHDGTYTLNENEKVLVSRFDGTNNDWYKGYSNYKYYYYCSDYTSTTCSVDDLRYLVYTSNSGPQYYAQVTNTFKFAHGFNYICEENNTNCKYVLDDNAITTFDFYQNNLKNYHYTCWNLSGECENVYYIYRVNGYWVDYINLSNGENINDAINKMLYAPDVDTKDSIMKIAIEAWFKHFLYDKKDYIEDINYCENRTISNKYGWDPDGDVDKNLRFNESNSDLLCPRETDMFSVNGNKLKYPISLMSSSEKINSGYLYEVDQRIYGDYRYVLNAPGGYEVPSMSSGFGSSSAGVSWGVRPVISLKPDTEYISGNGSKTEPYVVQ